MKTSRKNNITKTVATNQTKQCLIAHANASFEQEEGEMYIE